MQMFERTQKKKTEEKGEKQKRSDVNIFWASFCSLSSAYAAIGENDYSFFFGRRRRCCWKKASVCVHIWLDYCDS